jgi:hypothetical protein
MLLQHLSPPLPPPLCTNKVVPIGGATCDNLGGIGGCDWAKCFYFANNKLCIQVKQPI